MAFNRQPHEGWRTSRLNETLAQLSDRLAGEDLQSAFPASAFRMVRGVVATIDTNTTCSVTVGGDDAILEATPWMSPYFPAVGDTVYLLEQGTFRIIVGGNTTAYGIHRYMAAATQTTTSNVITDVNIDTTEWELPHSGAFVLTGSLNIYTTIPVTGVWRISGGANWAANGTGARLFQVRRDSDSLSFLASSVAPASATSGTVHNGMIESLLNAGDVMKLVARQQSGGNLNLNSGAGTPTDSFIGLTLLART